MLGTFDGRKLDGSLALKGYGDPYLVEEEVWKLVHALRRCGRGDRRRPRARRQLVRHARRARPRCVRRPAVPHVQRRAERLDDELQGGQVSVPRGPRAQPRPRRDGSHARQPHDQEQPIDLVDGACGGYNRRCRVQPRERGRRWPRSCSTASSRAAATAIRMSRTALQHDTYAFGLFQSAVERSRRRISTASSRKGSVPAESDAGARLAVAAARRGHP